MSGTLTTVCAWCTPGVQGEGITHGICPECAAKWKAQAKAAKVQAAQMAAPAAVDEVPEPATLEVALAFEALTLATAARLSRVSIPAAQVEAPGSTWLRRLASNLLRIETVPCSRCRSEEDVRRVGHFWPEDLCWRCRAADEREFDLMTEGLAIADGGDAEEYEHRLLCRWCAAGGHRAACRALEQLKAGGAR